MCTKRYMMRAFTLIELLIVIVIIGILATSLIPRIKGIQDKAKITSIKVLLNQAYTQAQIYHMNNGGTYAGLCNDTTIQGILGSLGGSGHASCYVHPNIINKLDWGIAANFKDVYYFTEPQGVMMLDVADASGGGQIRTNAMTICTSQGKKLPGASAYRAIRYLVTDAKLSLYFANRVYWSSIETDSDHAFFSAMRPNDAIGIQVKSYNALVRCASTQ